MHPIRNVLICVTFTVLFSFPSSVRSNFRKYDKNDVGACETPLLKELPDSAFTASSFLNNDPEFAPYAARMFAVYAQSDSKAWCPNKPVSDKQTEWLQIEFSSEKVIVNIFTLGRDDGNYGKFVTHYYLDYQQDSSSTWHRYRDLAANGPLINGNDDARNSAHKKLSSPIVAKRIKIIPVSIGSNINVCLRIGFYGCDNKDNPHSNHSTRAPNTKVIVTHFDSTISTFSTLIESASRAPSNYIYYLILALCVIGAAVILSLCLVLCFLWVKNRNRRRCKSKYWDQRSFLDATIRGPNFPTNCRLNTITGHNPLLYRPLTPHSLAATTVTTQHAIGIPYIYPSFPSHIDFRQTNNPNSNEYEAIDPIWPKPPATYEDQKPDQDRQSLLTSTPPDITNSSKTNCVPVYCSGSSYSSNPYSQPHSEVNYPAPDIIPVPPVTQETINSIIQNHLKSSLIGLTGCTISSLRPNSMSQTKIETILRSLPVITENNLKIYNILSDGECGMIVKAKAADTDNDLLVSKLKTNKMSDTAFSFYAQCFCLINDDFSSHPNVLSIIGKTHFQGMDEFPSILYDYSSRVNLVSFFEKLRQIQKPDDISFSCNIVSQSSLVFIVKQLISALSYLQDLDIIHRDIAARNCSLGDGLHLFLSDFAIGANEFNEDYVVISNSSQRDTYSVKLPLLWMPWESIIMNVFSTKSDVWSLGVTIWEIFTECQVKPYSQLLQNVPYVIPAIVRNAVLIANNQPNSILPNNRTLESVQSAPDKSLNALDVSKQIRDIMRECWRTDPALRPNFHTLYKFISDIIIDPKPIEEYGALYQLFA